LSKRLAREGLAISRLATGIPSGGSVEYADEITLGSAFKARQKV
jgi:recombination protein RecR